MKAEGGAPAERVGLHHALSRAMAFDLTSRDFKAEPHRTYDALRVTGPVIPVRLPLLGRAWLTTTHASTGAMLKDKARFVMEGRHAGKSGVAGMRWWMPPAFRLLTDNMLLKDEPDHRRLRKLVDRAFQRRDVQAMRGGIEAVADRLLDRIAGEAEADLIEAYARRLPLEVICDLLGLPQEDRGRFTAWTRSATAIRGPIGLLRAAWPIRQVVGYVRERIEAARRDPRPGLIAELVAAEADGDRLSERELVAMVFLLLVAGFETTTHLIGDSVIALEQNPEQKAWLLADPAARAERAVEELARQTSPVQSTKPRYVAEDCEFYGQDLARGEIILGFLAAANADPEVFERPEQLRLDRFPNPHLAFGTGIHHCLGMQLARVEAQAALTRIYARFPRLALAHPDRLDWIERLGIRGVATLPVRPAG